MNERRRDMSNSGKISAYGMKFALDTKGKEPKTFKVGQSVRLRNGEVHKVIDHKKGFGYLLEGCGENLYSPEYLEEV